MFLLFVYITHLFYREVRFISKGGLGKKPPGHNKRNIKKIKPYI